MQELFTGIWNLFNGDSNLSGSVSAMYPTMADEKATTPYIVYHLVGTTPGWFFGSPSEVTVYRIQFDIFSDVNPLTPTEPNTIVGYLKTLYDWSTPTVTGWNIVMVRRMGEILTKDDDKMWHYSVDYEFVLQQ